MKNYYEILEVDKNASDEIIKVAYKSLVKKYHPDLREGEEKRIAEEKIKQINEAYDVLSDSFKRNEYDQTLNNYNISPDEYNFILNENMQLKNELNYLKNNFNRQTSNNYYNQEQNNNYSNNQNANYENNKKISNYVPESLKSIFAFLLTFLIVFLVFKIPFLNDLLMNLFGEGFIFIILIVFVFFYFFRNKN